MAPSLCFSMICASTSSKNAGFFLKAFFPNSFPSLTRTIAFIAKPSPFLSTMPMLTPRSMEDLRERSLRQREYQFSERKGGAILFLTIFTFTRLPISTLSSPLIEVTRRMSRREKSRTSGHVHPLLSLGFHRRHRFFREFG